METTFKTRQMETQILGTLQVIVYHEVLTHNGKTYRIILEATERPYGTNYAKVEVLTDNGWAFFVDTKILGINFEHKKRILTNQYKEESERISAMDDIVNAFKKYIQIF